MAEMLRKTQSADIDILKQHGFAGYCDGSSGPICICQADIL